MSSAMIELRRSQTRNRAHSPDAVTAALPLALSACCGGSSTSLEVLLPRTRRRTRHFDNEASALQAAPIEATAPTATNFIAVHPPMSPTGGTDK